MDEILQNSVRFLLVSTKFGMNHGRKCLNMSFQDQLRIDLLAILQKSLDRAIFLYILMRKVRLNGVGASITIVHIRKFYKS